jgi:hypothetical protein
MKGGDNLEGLSDVREIGCEDVNWIYMDRGQWWAVVDTVTNLRVPEKAENFLTN